MILFYSEQTDSVETSIRSEEMIQRLAELKPDKIYFFHESVMGEAYVGHQKIPGGHVFRVNDDGSIWQYDDDYHGGPECVRCGDTWCSWCQPKRWEEQCPENAQPTLPTLEYVPGVVT